MSFWLLALKSQMLLGVARVALMVDALLVQSRRPFNALAKWAVDAATRDIDALDVN